MAPVDGNAPVGPILGDISGGVADAAARFVNSGAK